MPAGKDGIARVLQEFPQGQIGLVAIQLAPTKMLDHARDIGNSYRRIHGMPAGDHYIAGERLRMMGALDGTSDKAPAIRSRSVAATWQHAPEKRGRLQPVAGVADRAHHRPEKTPPTTGETTRSSSLHNRRRHVQKRIDDFESLDHLPMLQILSEQALAIRLQRGRDNQRIPR